MNNTIYDGYADIVGYRCWDCNGVFPSMWGTTCNACRKQNEISALQKKKLKLEIKKLQNENSSE